MQQSVQSETRAHETLASEPRLGVAHDGETWSSSGIVGCPRKQTASWDLVWSSLSSFCSKNFAITWLFFAIIVFSHWISMDSWEEISKLPALFGSFNHVFCPVLGISPFGLTRSSNVAGDGRWQSHLGSSWVHPSAWPESPIYDLQKIIPIYIYIQVIYKII